MSELYALPEGWEWKKLDDCTDLITKGTTPTTYGYKFLDKGINFLKIENIINGKINLDSIDKFISEEANQSQKRSILQVNDVLFSIAGTIGDTAIVEEKHLPMNTNQAIAIIRPKKNLDSQFLKQSLLSVVSQSTKKKQRGGAIKNISLGDIKNTNIPLPPLQEQKRIVAKLDNLFTKIDQAIALHQQNIDEVEGFMGSVLSEIFTKLETKYKKIPLFEVADVNRGKSKHRPRNDKKLFDGEYPFIQTGDVRNANKYITTYEKSYSEFGLAQSRLWKKGTVCMTIAANIGDVAILGIDSCFPDSVVGLYSEKNSNEFLYFFLQTLKQHLESQATTTAQMNINLKVLKTIGVPLPSLRVQEKIVSYLNNIYEKNQAIKEIQKEKMQSLKALKASILDRAFRGEF